MGIYNCASRDRVAMKFVSVFTGACAAALFATSGCGVGTSKSKKTVASEDLKGTAFQKIAAKSTTASKLSLKGGKILRALSKEGEVLGVNIGILSPIEAEGIPFKTLISEPGEGYAAAANLGWFLGAKEVVHYSIEAGTPSFLRADLQASHPVVGVTQDELVTFFDGKLEIFSRSGSNIVRTVVDWPLKGEKPLSVGFDKAAKTYWVASEKNFVYLPANGSPSAAAIPLKIAGYKGQPKAWAFNPTASDLAQKKLPASGAVLTDEGLYVTKDLIAGAQAPQGNAAVPDTTETAALTKYDFTKDILPIAKIGCPACHDASFANFGIVSAEASWTKAKDLLIDKLGEKPKVGNSMPLSPGVLTPANRAVLIAWLKGENRIGVAAGPTPTPAPIPDTGKVLLSDSGWTSAGLGDGTAQLQNNNNGTFSLKGTGADIYGVADSGAFVYRQVSGDFTMTVRIDSVENQQDWVKMGLMVRTSLDANSRMVLHGKTLNAVVRTIDNYRQTAGQMTVDVVNPQDEKWLRLKRTGQTLNAFVSADGNTWAAYGNPIAGFGNDKFIGVAFAPNSTTLTGTQVSNFELTVP